MQNYYLPIGYHSNLFPASHDDWKIDPATIWQPDVYIAAYWHAVQTDNSIVDLGCGFAQKLSAMPAIETIGFDRPECISACREAFPEGDWRTADLSLKRYSESMYEAVKGKIVICSDVIEHLTQPEHLLNFLFETRNDWAGLFLSTPDRGLVREAGTLGPPENTSHVREWTIKEFCEMLDGYELCPTIFRHGRDNIRDEIDTSIITYTRGNEEFLEQ